MSHKIIQKQTIDDEKIVNFSMVTSIKKHILDLKEMEINLTKRYNDSIENIQNKINNMKINVIKQKNLIRAHRNIVLKTLSTSSISFSELSRYYR
jgi:hypothetical protein